MGPFAVLVCPHGTHFPTRDTADFSRAAAAVYWRFLKPVAGLFSGFWSEKGTHFHGRPGTVEGLYEAIRHCLAVAARACRAHRRDARMLQAGC